MIPRNRLNTVSVFLLPLTAFAYGMGDRPCDAGARAERLSWLSPAVSNHGGFSFSLVQHT